MKTLFCALALLLLASNVVQAEVFQNVQYLGGFPDLKNDKVKGDLEITDQELIFWKGSKKKEKALFRIPTQTLTDVAVGNRARRRVVSAVLWSPWLLFAKKRNDLVRFEFKDLQNRTGGAPVIMVKKDAGEGIRMVSEAKTGKNFDTVIEDSKKPVKTAAVESK